ncbi:MAG: hypothetical protein D8M59_07635 [Planctomycetes bacterium]|nr:hypothetical protein [Planctomycetota bacterium]
MSPTRSLLYELMGFGHFQQVAMTRDGLLIGQPHRCSGFDAFIGSPTPTQIERTGRLWLELDPAERQAVLTRLAEQGISPERVGISVESDRVRSRDCSGSCSCQTTGRCLRRCCHG